jgi:hypothetical protein
MAVMLQNIHFRGALSGIASNLPPVDVLHLRAEAPGQQAQAHGHRGENESLAREPIMIGQDQRQQEKVPQATSPATLFLAVRSRPARYRDTTTRSG